MDIANDHDAQWGDVEGGKGEQVIGCLLPAFLETPVSHTLGEIDALDGVQVEEKELKQTRGVGKGSDLGMRCIIISSLESVCAVSLEKKIYPQKLCFNKRQFTGSVLSKRKLFNKDQIFDKRSSDQPEGQVIEQTHSNSLNIYKHLKPPYKI